MKYKVKLNKKVNKFLNSHQIIAISFFLKVKDLSEWKLENLDIQKLKWKDNCYRLRIWKYRFLYKIIKDEIFIFFYDANSRWDIY